MNYMNKEKGSKYPAVKTEILNPKAVSINELFGFIDLNFSSFFIDDFILSGDDWGDMISEESNIFGGFI